MHIFFADREPGKSVSRTNLFQETNQGVVDLEHKNVQLIANLAQKIPEEIVIILFFIKCFEVQKKYPEPGGILVQPLGDHLVMDRDNLRNFFGDAIPKSKAASEKYDAERESDKHRKLRMTKKFNRLNLKSHKSAYLHVFAEFADGLIQNIADGLTRVFDK